MTPRGNSELNDQVEATSSSTNALLMFPSVWKRFEGSLKQCYLIIYSSRVQSTADISLLPQCLVIWFMWRTAGIFSLCSSGILLHSLLPFSSSLSPGSWYHLGSPEDLCLLQVNHGCPWTLALYSLPAGEEKCSRLAMGRLLLDLHSFSSNMGLQRGHAG